MKETLTRILEKLEGKRKDEPEHAGYSRVEASQYGYERGFNSALDLAIQIIKEEIIKN